LPKEIHHIVRRPGKAPGVMDHYVETGQLIGKRTDDLEGFDLKGHFALGFFDLPRGRVENLRFEEPKDRLSGRDPTPEELRRFGDEVREALNTQRETTG